jgi:predicted acylesterase/phospholipase RssA
METRNHNEIMESVWDMTVNGALVGSILDITFPWLALSSGRFLATRYQRMFGQSRIEDLLIPYFCVSTNLRSYSQHIHKNGCLWLACRASSGLPALLPPVVDGEVRFQALQCFKYALEPAFG